MRWRLPSDRSEAQPADVRSAFGKKRPQTVHLSAPGQNGERVPFEGMAVRWEDTAP
jgi:hypothetical protein